MTTLATRSRIDIQFLGQVHVHAESGSIMINDKKAILLMFVLAVRGATSRQQMASLLWPGTDGEHSQGSLRLRIHKINRLCPGLIQSHLNSIFLSPAVGHDIAFLTAEEEIPLPVALEAHRNNLIGSLDFPENPQLNAVLNHYKNQLISKSTSLLYRHARAAATSRSLDQAVYFLNRILLLSPHNETACRNLMRVHVLNGCRASAIEAYEAFRHNMRENLGIEPDAKTKRLHLDILSAQEDPEYQTRISEALDSMIL
ncbi:BTAD domain-containing putative transcriptional regulator [Thiomonas sp.]|jgi:DNA-binding SARP family transcriptional activator|uniref:AfsR/SARP family transcriptional regulator n=1 Tax=Thiomonas sp. TaxID=2047785 RepID=UPI00260D2206|nr:BTAD domain-containing putative transcriptional regulator [Thiomonas sp.]